MATPVMCEYFIQNEEAEVNAKLNPFPNVFMLTKKYNSISDVRLQEVLEAFPLSLSD